MSHGEGLEKTTKLLAAAAPPDFGQFENHFDPDDCPEGAPGPCPVDVRTSISGFGGSLVGIVPIGETTMTSLGVNYRW